MKSKIYLAGKGQELGYRDKFKQLYSKHFELFDPMRDGSKDIIKKHHPGLTLEDIMKDAKKYFTKQFADDIVRNDKCHLANSDYVVAFIEEPTFGTCMEVLYAFMHQIPVFVITPNMTLKNDIWLSYHTTKFFNSIEECGIYIIETERFEKGK